MRRKTTKLLFSAVLSILAIVVTACNLTSLSPAVSNVEATYTAVSEVLFTQAAALPLATPTVEETIVYFPTLEPDLQTTTAQPTAIVETLIPTSTSTPTPGPIPSYYILQAGEFPYCIARRFNVDPKELLTINNLSSGLIYAPGLTLSIPQSGLPFPTTRALNPHPTTYIVPEYQMTVNKVACYFGDVDPVAIMDVNGLTSPILSVGQTLNIP